MNVTADPTIERLHERYLEKGPTWEKLSDDQLWWCNTHQRRATHQFFGNGWTDVSCDPNLGGITMPCMCVSLKGIAEITEEDK